jgi:hypothetical protein
MHNAAKYHTMLECFTRHLETLGIPLNSKTHRLPCAGHIINLSGKAFWFGNSEEAVRDSTYRPGTADDLESRRYQRF